MTQDYSSPTIDNLSNVEIIKPRYFTETFDESSETIELINQLNLEGHQEGGFFKETDRSPFKIVNPNKSNDDDDADKFRNYSTLIYYLLTPQIPFGRFHKNLNRIIHILQSGRGQYVLIYPNGEIKSFIVGFNHSKGEVSQWVVPGGVYKASFLLPLNQKECNNDKLLISEVVVPGFEYRDHEFLEKEGLEQLVGDRAHDLSFLLHNK